MLFPCKAQMHEKENAIFYTRGFRSGGNRTHENTAKRIKAEEGRGN